MSLLSRASTKLEGPVIVNPSLQAQREQKLLSWSIPRL